MSGHPFFDSALFTWGLLPLLIFISRIFDVTLGTIRIIFVARGRWLLAPLLGFFEVFIWLMAIGQIMQHLDNILCYLAYAGGFATGNYVGIRVEEKLAVGFLSVRIIVSKDRDELKERLIKSGFGVTVIEGRGANEEVKMMYSIIKRKDLDDLIKVIEDFDPNIFYTIEDAKSAYQGIFPHRKQQPTGMKTVFHRYKEFGENKKGK